MSQLLLPTKLTIRKIGERGRSCTYGVSYVADLQSAAFAARRTRPDNLADGEGFEPSSHGFGDRHFAS